MPVNWDLFTRRENLYPRQLLSLIASDLLLMFADTGSQFTFKIPVVQ